MKKGFTLVELLIVLAVIAALMAVATPMALNAVKQAKASQVAQNLSALKSAVEQYVYSEKAVPTSIDNLKNYVTNFDAIQNTYKLKYENFDNTGQATIVIVYDGIDVTAPSVANQYTLAGTVTLADGVTNTGKPLPGTTVTVAKWW